MKIKKVWKDLVVEDMLVQSLNNRRQACHHHLMVDHAREIVDERRNAFDVIKMEMREEYMFHALLFFQCKSRGKRAGIHHQFVINQKTDASADG